MTDDARPSRRRWPLLLIGAAAGTATWTGWVGLGGLTGFGVVQPLPGIWDGLHLNTAVTLPIGVEAYAVYALSVATDHGHMPEHVRRYAWRSAAAALGVGMAGQVAYHVMAAHGVTQAPWWVVALVSCLPVAVLGAASYLWHLAGAVERTKRERAWSRQNAGARKTTPAQADTSTPAVSGSSTASATGSGLVLAAGRSSGGGPRKSRDEVRLVAVRMRDDLGDWPPYRRLALEAGCARGTAEKVLRELKEAA